ncbi:MAG: CoA pyrophosphatase [Propionibacteriaceae bacterium]|nr:CoA pyrophosphatase [Propionibacteriaceae bacterium]
MDSQWPSVSQNQRLSAVVALLTNEDDSRLLFTLRASGLSHHGGQISFPGGGRESQDSCPRDTAFREMSEEIGLDPACVHPLGQLRTREISVSSNHVIPIVATWSGLEEVLVHDPEEVDSILSWSLSELADPVHRVTARFRIGYTGPAWQMGDLFLWGFTARLVDILIDLGGWYQPWDKSRIVDVPKRFQ